MEQIISPVPIKNLISAIFSNLFFGEFNLWSSLVLFSLWKRIVDISISAWHWGFLANVVSHIKKIDCLTSTKYSKVRKNETIKGFIIKREVDLAAIIGVLNTSIYMS